MKPVHAGSMLNDELGFIITLHTRIKNNYILFQEIPDIDSPTAMLRQRHDKLQ
jgi:hypothetical protein